jgi:ABC-type nitrate/sulfonate/bicarbonate transport system substrate-binding protein
MRNKGLLCVDSNIGLLIVACISAIVCTPISTGFAQARRTSMCVTSHSVNLLAPFVAQKKEVFKSEGLDVDIVQALSTVCLTGVASNTIDYATSWDMAAPVRGLPVRGVMAMHNGSDYGFMARKEIKQFKDLKGSAVGVSRIGSGAEIVARFILEKQGLVPGKDVKMLPLGSMDARVAGLEQGLVAAAIISMPFTFELENKGYRALVWGPAVMDLPFLNGITTSTDKIKNRPDEVKKIIRAILKANRFIRDEREQSIRLMMQWARVNEELARKSYEVTLPGFTLTGEPNMNAVKILLEQAKKDLGVTQEVSLSSVSDFSLLKSAQKELNISR